MFVDVDKFKWHEKLDQYFNCSLLLLPLLYTSLCMGRKLS